MSKGEKFEKDIQFTISQTVIKNTSNKSIFTVRSLFQQSRYHCAMNSLILYNPSSKNFCNTTMSVKRNVQLRSNR